MVTSDYQEEIKTLQTELDNFYLKAKLKIDLMELDKRQQFEAYHFRISQAILSRAQFSQAINSKTLEEILAMIMSGILVGNVLES